ncbi:MAG: hypothetical protein QOK16_1831 [Solirubrobacteraceae bacterium]|nr:hypothetical protein [Solirubrobacteraceae bacterium]
MCTQPDGDVFVSHEALPLRPDTIWASPAEDLRGPREAVACPSLFPLASCRGPGGNWLGSSSSLRLIREIHEELLRDGRGAQATPGGFRTTQNWIGPSGACLSQAAFVPSPVPDMMGALYAFENYLHPNGDTPVLVKTAPS